MLLADRGYDADWIRAFAAKRRAWANIPPRSYRNEPICFSPIFTAPVVQLASIRLWLRVNERRPSSQTV